jgi:tetratricopeptide (TPR) repeat protein
MGRIEKTVFISYRRTNFYTALAVYQYLTQHGYDAFFDYQSIDSGDFSKAILENIEAKAHFVLILSPSALERCNQPGDWLRREIETAIELNRNIVPMMMEGFDFGNPATVEALTGKLAALSSYNGLRLYADYFFDAMEKLRTRFLNKATDDLRSREISTETKAANINKKSLADEAEPVEQNQLSAEEWFERAFAFQENKNFDEAIRCYQEAIRLNPDYAAAHNNLGVLLKDLKRYDEAEVNYRKAIELNPSLPEAYSNLGILLKNLKRYEEAEVNYRKAIEVNPDYATAYYGLGYLLNNLKRYEEAEVNYRKAIELNEASPSGGNPDYASAYYNLGNLLRDLKRYEEAEVNYRKAIELDPDDATAYSNLGSLLSDLKRSEEAEAAYRKAIEIKPDYATAYSNLGNLLRDLKRYDEAEVNYRKAIELDPLNDNRYIRLINLYRFDLNKPQDALPLLVKRLDLNPENFHAHLALASIGKHLGKEFAKENIEKARQFMPEDDWYNRACLESVCDNFDLAFEYLEKAAKHEEFDPVWAWQDPDLQWLRNYPRFTEIVGSKPE